MSRLSQRGSSCGGVSAALIIALLAANGAKAAQTSIPSGTTTTVSGTTQDYGTGVNIDGKLAISTGGIVNADDYSNMATVPTNAFLTVSGAGSQFNLTYHDLNVGTVSGANSTISVTNGGTVSLDSNFNASNAAGATTTILVDGAGSSLSTGFQLGLGNAAGSVANVTISNGGTIHAQANQCCDFLGEGVIFIGVNGTANVKVTGATSSLIADWPYIWVGSIPGAGGTGVGTLTVSNGGLVETGSGSGSIYLAYQSGSTGTLNIGAPAGQAAAAPGTIDASQVIFGGGSGQIVFNHTSDDYTFAPQISGSGSVLVLSGRTIFDTSNAYTSTAIDGGVLEVDGSVTNTSAIAVNSGGTLSGTGTVTDATINAGGTLSPGSLSSPYGTFTVNGALAFAPKSFYAVALSPTQNSFTTVTGATTIEGGSVKATVGGGAISPGTVFTILTANGGVNGAFSGVTSNLAFFKPTLSYDSNDVFLTAAYNYLTPGGTPNERALGQALNTAARVSGGGGTLFNALNQIPTGQGAAALDSLSGEGITATQNLANRSAQQFNDAIFDQTTFYGNGGAGNQIVLTDAPPAFTAYAPLSGDRTSLYGPPVHELADLPAAHIAPTFAAPTRTWRAWATGFGGTEDIHGNGAIGSAAQDNTIYGGALGVDYQLMPNYLFGVAVGGSDGNFQVPGRTTYGSTTGGHIAIYDLATFGSFYGASSSSFSYFTNRTTRFVGGFGGLGSETERGNFDSHEYRTRLEFGRHFDGFGFGTLTPFIALEIAELRSNGFGETSVSGPGLFRLNVSGQSAADVPGYLGLRYQTVMPLGGMTFLPSLQVAYVHEFAPYRSQTAALADLPGSTFLVDGARPARDAAQVKAGGELKIGPNSALFANFAGEFSGVNQLYAGKGGLRWVW